MARVPKFKSIENEREFWATHDVIETLGEAGWKVSKRRATKVTSIYVARVGSRGAVVRVPKEWLACIGARKGKKIRARVMGRRLVMEVA
jgi:hypothetical protein